MVVSSGAAQMSAHIHTAVGSQPGQRIAAIWFQSPGSPDTQASGSGAPGQSSPTRISPCAARLSGVESLPAIWETTAVQSLHESEAASANMAEVRISTFIVEYSPC